MASTPTANREATSMNNEIVQQLLEQIRRDTGGAFVTGLAYIGDRLGLFAAVAQHGPVDSFALAAATDLNERYVREWLKALAAFGYIEYDDADQKYAMSEEQRAVLADEGSAVFGAGTFHFTLPSLLRTEQLMDVFRNGGIAYDELHPEVPAAIDRMHRAWFDHLLTDEWLPVIPGVDALLQKGIRVLDVGCGLGRSTIAIARAYPSSSVLGVDPHPPSIEFARALATEGGIVNAEFVALPLQRIEPDLRFELVIAIDCIHDMADPVGALRTVREHLSDDGLLVWSEPAGSMNPLENRDTLSRMRAALSPFHCLTISLAGGGPGLGTLIGTEGAQGLAVEAGFEQFETLPVPCETQLFFGLQR